MKASTNKIAQLKRWWRTLASPQGGLTLVEVLLAMSIFLVISTGIAGTMIVGLKATAHARLATMGKTAAQEQIEEMRSRPFYVPYSNDTTVGTTADVDLLDRYYPDVNTNNTVDPQGWQGWYTSSGNDAYYTKVSPPDANGITRTVVTKFIDNAGNVIVPPSSYDSNATGVDTPPSSLVKVIITTSWPEAGGQGRFTLESEISATGQYSAGGGVGGGAGSDCEHASNSHADVIGGILTAFTGTGDSYTEIVNGKFGEAHATGSYGCNPSMTASAIGGQMDVVGGSSYKGATVAVSGPPDTQQNEGPISVGPPSTYPKPTISNSYAKGKVKSEDEGVEVEAEGELNIGSQSLQLEEVSGLPTGTLNGYMRWDFINPTVTVTGAGGGDDGEDIEAEIEQENGATKAEGEVAYQQISILPLKMLDWRMCPTATPSAPQGLVFIRNFKAKAESRANGEPGGASNTLTYSATVGMFNPIKAGCTIFSTGDKCYDLYQISPSNPIQNIDLSNPGYLLQKLLFTEWYSYTTADIYNAMFASADGTNATISVDALIKITAIYGVEVNWKIANPHKNLVSLVNQLGQQRSWIGAFDISVTQNQ